MSGTEKKSVKINFSGFWEVFDKEDNIFINTLRKEFDPVISEDPDYLFYSVFSDDYLKFKDDVIRIFFTGENQIPDFNLADYAIGFDHLSFGDRYKRFPLYNMYPGSFKGALIRGGMLEKPERREEFCSFVVSNASADPFRAEFFRMLSEKRKVNSGGRLYNNIGAPVEDKIAFEKKHRFSICFENSSYPGYTTEKIIQAFAAGTIPIYWGDPEIGKVFDKNAFINVSDFEDPNEAIERILKIDDDPESFRAMLTARPFLPGNTPDEQISEIQDFILSIFRRPKESAYRRNRTFWGRNYERFFDRYCGINSKLRSIKRLFGK